MKFEIQNGVFLKASRQDYVAKHCLQGRSARRNPHFAALFQRVRTK